MSGIGAPRKVTPSDTAEVAPFQYLQVGTSGNVAVEDAKGTVTIITADLLDRVSICPCGLSVKVNSTDTTATDIYVWS